MILNFKFKSYVCNYYVGKKLYKDLCFSSGCREGKKGKYAYVTYIWPKNKQHELNYCYFDRKTLFEYFTTISKLLGFKLISFIETSQSYKLQINVIAEHRYFIYVSTYIRYIYEHPFAFLLYCAWQNRDNFPELQITHIMQFYIALFFDGCRCHCPGLNNLTYYNINSKCQFSLIRDNFNCHDSFLTINSKHISLCDSFKIINTKILPQVATSVNNLANKYYAKYKKDICCW